MLEWHRLLRIPWLPVGRIRAVLSPVWRRHPAILMRILRITTVGMCLLRPSLRLLRISVLATISLSWVAVWLLSGMCGLCRHFLLWHGRLLLWPGLLNSLLLNLRYRFRHWQRLCLRLLYLRRRGLLHRLLDLGLLRLSLLGFLHHCEEISLSH